MQPLDHVVEYLITDAMRETGRVYLDEMYWRVHLALGDERVDVSFSRAIMSLVRRNLLDMEVQSYPYRVILYWNKKEDERRLSK